MQNETASKETILEIRDLKVNIKTDEGTLTAVRGVNLTIKKGETLGLVGESGCGKSLTSKAILGINDKKCKAEGEIIFDAENLGRVNLLSLNPRGKEIRSVRGKQISMIFQDPFSSLDPRRMVGETLGEALERCSQIPPKGEYVLVVAGLPDIPAAIPETADITAHLNSLMEQGLSRKDAIRQTAKDLKLPKNAVYEIATKEASE